MNEIIKPHSFEEAKKHIQTFSSRTSPSFGLEKVNDSGGLFGWFDHNVTGSELNKITCQVQDYFIKFNGLNSDFIIEFGQVYKALESLDGEYIPAILSAVKGAEEASNQAKEAQLDIKKMIEAQNKIITILENHKKKLDKLKHLESIDDLWYDTQRLQKDIKTSRANFENAQKQVSRFEESLKAVQKYADSLLDYEHLDDIDDIWEKVVNTENAVVSHSLCIDEINKEISKITSMLTSIEDTLKEFKSFAHFVDIDQIWSDVEKCKVSLIDYQKIESQNSENVGALKIALDEIQQFKSLLEEQHHLSEIDTLWNSVEYERQEINRLKTNSAELISETTSISEKLTTLTEFKTNLQEQQHLLDIDCLWNGTESSLASLKIKADYFNNEIQNIIEIHEEYKQTQQTVVECLKKKIKTSNIISCGAIGLAVFEFFLIITGIL